MGGVDGTPRQSPPKKQSPSKTHPTPQPALPLANPAAPLADAASPGAVEVIPPPKVGSNSDMGAALCTGKPPSEGAACCAAPGSSNFKWAAKASADKVCV